LDFIIKSSISAKKKKKTDDQKYFHIHAIISEQWLVGGIISSKD
jgi:hypothetical protein